MPISRTATSGCCFGGQLNRFPSIAGFGYHFEIRLLIEQETQAGPNDGVIVSQQNPDLCHLQPFNSACVCR